MRMIIIKIAPDRLDRTWILAMRCDRRSLRNALRLSKLTAGP
ncbi:hypothetical protein QUA43_04025 [Microcoleus sp. N9_B4]